MLAYLASAIAAIGVALNGFNPRAVEPTVCGQKKRIQYCYYEGSERSSRVVYYMHGFGDDVQGWTVNAVTGRIEKLWSEAQVERPHIVSIDRGVWWYVDSSEGEELRAFVEEVERELFSFQPDRVLYGDSMGGHNGLRWMLDHPDLFPRAALLCPAMPRAWVENPGPTEGFPPWQLLAEQLIAEYYNGSKDPKFNPIRASEVLQGRVHLVATPKDDFGFYPANRELARVLEGNPNVDFSFEWQRVKHCQPEASELARFLLD